MTFTFRHARAEDALAVVHMHRQAHRETYGDYLSAEYFERRAAQAAELAAARAPYLESADPRVLAFDHDGGLMGFADAGKSRDEDRPDGYELYSIYVLASAYGTGLGRELFQRAVPDGVETSLWVHDQNARALRFYSKLGFVPDGTSRESQGDWAGVNLIRMVRPAEAGPSGDSSPAIGLLPDVSGYPSDMAR